MGKELFMTQQELIILLNEKVCDIADALMLYYNPCELHDFKCKAGNPNSCCKHTRFGDGVCPFLKTTCTFRNTKCKLWFCATVLKDIDPKFINSIKILEQFSDLYSLISKPFIGQPYVGADK